jgi:hypothetical protein
MLSDMTSIGADNSHLGFCPLITQGCVAHGTTASIPADFPLPTAAKTFNPLDVLAWFLLL